MALAPRSSLCSLVLLMSHGKPQLSAFFSSAGTTAAPKAAKPPAAPAGDSPAIDPPAAAGTDAKISPETEGSCHTLGPEADKISPGATKDPEGTVPEGSCDTPQPVSDDPPSGARKDPMHGVPENP
ncbi:hypothetical protein CFC21_098743 [Triticum aestivum]|uniref:Uncharacterized protein n=3 Tax=Triticum TaxID=4564 RepID=A0A9R1N161_WHEAT|nr:uncharacterized protein LOC123151877 [Triticum aestivum]EMS63293.1 hypothetical protein TRIUR3_15868 [Triticum urartu]KAF7096853.1 hypothetical protein CFC21_098743 [Triticum aestivum]